MTAEAKLDKILVFELIIALKFYALVKVGAVTRAQVDDVRLDPLGPVVPSARIISISLHDKKKKKKMQSLILENSEVRLKV